MHLSMLTLSYTVFARIRVSCPVSRFQFSSFSSVAPKFVSQTARNLDSTLIVNYLENTFGFSQEKALAAAKHIHSTECSESVVAFLKNRGFTSDQIGTIVRYTPMILRYDPQKILMPKIEFFLSSGIPEIEVNNIIRTAPDIFCRSLENQLKPSFNYIKTLFGSNGASLTPMKNLASVFCCNLESQLIPNIEILRNAGVPDSRIVTFLQRYPKSFFMERKSSVNCEVVKEVKKMNFNPCKSAFILAIHAIRTMSKLTWEQKVTAYKNWGLSENDIILAFQKQPLFMTSSVDKINAVMGFLVTEMEFNPSIVVWMPNIVLLSLEMRLKPRLSIYKILVAHGLIEKSSFLNSILYLQESAFLRRFVHLYEKDVPGLLQSYQKNLVVLKS